MRVSRTFQCVHCVSFCDVGSRSVGHSLGTVLEANEKRKPSRRDLTRSQTVVLMRSRSRCRVVEHRVEPKY